MSINLVNLVIKVRTDHASRLIAHLAMSGKAYATACRDLVCRWPVRDCNVCCSHDCCGWYLVFGQTLATDPIAVKRHQKPPLPFVFSFPCIADMRDSLDEIECGLVVLGPAISYIEMLLNGFSELLSGEAIHCPAEIVMVACRDFQGSVQNACVARSCGLIPDNLVIASTEGLLENRAWSGSELQVRFRSALRLVENGHPVIHFEFSRFVRSLMRRVSSLTYYYGENELDCDFKELSRQADNVVCVDDHFGYRPSKNKAMTGIVGFGNFKGDFSGLMPFLAIGMYVHTGKGSSFGMGSYELG